MLFVTFEHLRGLENGAAGVLKWSFWPVPFCKQLFLGLPVPRVMPTRGTGSREAASNSVNNYLHRMCGSAHVFLEMYQIK